MKSMCEKHPYSDWKQRAKTEDGEFILDDSGLRPYSVDDEFEKMWSKRKKRSGKMFKKIMNYIKDFLENTPEDIYDFSCELEGILIVHYDEMHNEQSKATKILNDETPDICASAEPGMTQEEIEEFKRKLKIEYDRVMEAVV